jgi:GntR family transcriptional regulator
MLVTGGDGMDSLTKELTMPPRVSHVARVTADIRARIESGQWPPGHKLPTLQELIVMYREMFGPISETPIKTALRDLQTLGWLEGQQGKGVFVAPRPPPPPEATE